MGPVGGGPLWEVGAGVPRWQESPSRRSPSSNKLFPSGNRTRWPPLPTGDHKEFTQMKRIVSTMAILVLSGGLALAQGAGGGGGAGGAGGGAGGAGAGTGSGGNGGGTPGGNSTITPTNPTSGSTSGQSPGVNPSNPQDRTGRNNPNDITKPGGNNP